MQEIKEKIKGVCTKYDLGELLSFEKIKEGVLNENHVFTTDKGKFFLKNCYGKSISQIQYIYDIEKFMKESGLPAITAISVDKEDHYMLYPFIESDREHSYEISDYYRMGQMLAYIHMVSFDKGIPQKFKQFYHTKKDASHILRKIKEYRDLIDNKKIKNDTDYLFLKYIDKKLSFANDFIDTDNLPDDTIIHGDYHAGNLLIDKDSREIIGICDWEKAEYAPKAYEVARAYLYVGFGTNVDDVNICQEISESFLQGYRNTLPLSDEDFKKGLKMRLKSYIFSYWMEDKYYTQKDSRANKFLNSSIRILDYFCKK